MTDEDAVAVMKMINGHWGLNMDEPTRKLWMAALIDEDAQSSVAVVAHLAQKMHYAPKISDFKEVMRLLHPPQEPPPLMPQPKLKREEKIPLWIRRWIAARYLYRRFGREQDMRPFPEQAGHVDPLTSEWMPDEEWVAEAERVTDADVWGAIRS